MANYFKFNNTFNYLKLFLLSAVSFLKKNQKSMPLLSGLNYQLKSMQDLESGLKPISSVIGISSVDITSKDGKNNEE